MRANSEHDDALLRVEGLSVGFPDRRGVPQPAIDNLTFSVASNEMVALVGESGSGKSVTALAIMRLLRGEQGCISAGRILFRRRDGTLEDLVQQPESRLRAIRGNEIAMIFQEPMNSLNPVLPVGDQLAEVLELHGRRDRRQARREALDLMSAVKIPEPQRRLEQYPHELSGGMRQRVMIAMAIACRPSLLIADEPTTALDVTIQALILNLIGQLRLKTGMAVLFITHDMGVVAETADRVVVLRSGSCVEQAPVHRFFNAPRHGYSRRLLDAVPKLGCAPALPPPPPGAEAVLDVRHLAVHFPIRRGLLRKPAASLHAVDNVSFQLHPGETIGLVGESGSGKTTTARAILGLVKPTAGEIRVGREAVNSPPARHPRPTRQGLQMVFQDPYASLNPRLAIVDSVTEPLVIQGGLSRHERRHHAENLLRRVGLTTTHLDRYPHQFSGGQRQRICIARALSTRPRVLIADEPVSALDVSIQARVIDLLLELQCELGMAYLFISHDIAVVERVSHRIAVMYRGQIVEQGPTGSVLQDPRHPYTRRLLAAVPVSHPDRRGNRPAQESLQVASPLHREGDRPARRALTEVSPGHFVMEA
jgi:peptide/nickel transport system ATP-binding protein/glutathione transport system ATP-binding protein